MQILHPRTFSFCVNYSQPYGHDTLPAFPRTFSLNLGSCGGSLDIPYVNGLALLMQILLDIISTRTRQSKHRLACVLEPCS